MGLGTVQNVVMCLDGLSFIPSQPHFLQLLGARLALPHWIGPELGRWVRQPLCKG